MAYRTILVHLDNDSGRDARLRLGAAMAAAVAGHLEGAAFTGLSRHLLPSLPPEQDDPTLALHLAMLRDQSRGALDGVEAICQAAGLASCSAVLHDDAPDEGLSLLARAADLVLLGQAGPDARAAAAALPVHVVLHGGRPVLILPPSWQGERCGERILVAWDGTREAALALHSALPFLQQAAQVELAVFEGGAVADAYRADPRAWLARHGVHASMAVHPVGKRRTAQRRHPVGDALLAHADASGADLLVMGAYGHSRFREIILGGVTKTVLDSMTLPVLMAH